MSAVIGVINLLRDQEAHFTHADVVAITGVNNSDLQNWANRKLVAPAVDAPGKQGKRRYDYSRLLWIEIASKLIGLGFQASHAFGIADQAIGNAIKYILDKGKKDEATRTIEMPDLDLHQVFTAVRRVDDHKHIVTTFVETNIPIDRLLGGPSVVINTGELIITLFGKVNAYFEQTVPGYADDADNSKAVS
jgi:hypothetical protein